MMAYESRGQLKGVGNNVPMERFFKSLKNEWVLTIRSSHIRTTVE